ncbi:predicted protein [Ostreococcus lucimarinus CCE9901]|uniref:Uncharacterized protein n=1 Tax=Ostreococcus lucimarinus (strain CCE9901) TaxID=436017 RepID=A4S5N7_OSTLU|nr:predicted protein [Ostreococcus lucimarinus CCE9901]ABO98935.1 predicted protein [Ostreococcus lucimarinus CCE9901]|eukprot:XP_001420642.1 predicted protein [Ostreococcus lucimarinus CCE9901]
MTNVSQLCTGEIWSVEIGRGSRHSQSNAKASQCGDARTSLIRSNPHSSSTTMILFFGTRRGSSEEIVIL